MRIISTTNALPQWFLTLYFREVGCPQILRVGSGKMLYGRGMEHYGNIALAQLEVKNEIGSVEVFPGARLMAVVMSDRPGIDERFQASLSERDEVELVRPNEIVTADYHQMLEVTSRHSFLQKQDGRRKLIT